MMAKRKAFGQIAMDLPTTGAQRAADGVIHFPKEAIPPIVTRVVIARGRFHNRTFDFKEYYGFGGDEIVYALQNQIERLVAGEDKKLACQSILTVCSDGVVPFLKYLIARCTAEQRDINVSDINCDLIDGYIGWLRDSGNSRHTQRNYYQNIRSLITCLSKRGLTQIITHGDSCTFPKNPFPRADRSIKGEKPFPKAQRQSISKALKKAVLPLFNPDVTLDSYLLTVALLLVALHVGRNTVPLLEMKVDCLRPHPKSGVSFLVLFKRRGYSTHKVALREAKGNDATSDVTLAPAVRHNVASLIQRVIKLTEPLRAEAPEHLKDLVWLFRSKGGRGTHGHVICLGAKVLEQNIRKFVNAHELTDFDGKPLRLNISRLRKTFINRIFEILDGDIVTTAIVSGHSRVRTTDLNYLRPGENAMRNWNFMGQLLTKELLSGTIENTPLAGCSDPRNGQYAPKREGETCTSFLNCLRCRNYVVTADDLYKLFSFELRILKERNRMDKRKWKERFGHIPRLIERDVIKAGITQKKFKAANVETARERAKRDPHPFWLTDSLISDLEALA